MSEPTCLPTLKLSDAVCVDVRVGASPELAAAKHGVPPSLFAEWMDRGSASPPQQPYRAFTDAVRQAHAGARAEAEILTLTRYPVLWLKHGPGKDGGCLLRWPAPDHRLEPAAAPAPAQPTVAAEAQPACNEPATNVQRTCIEVGGDGPTPCATITHPTPLTEPEEEGMNWYDIDLTEWARTGRMPDCLRDLDDPAPPSRRGRR